MNELSLKFRKKYNLGPVLDKANFSKKALKSVLHNADHMKKKHHLEMWISVSDHPSETWHSNMLGGGGAL